MNYRLFIISLLVSLMILEVNAGTMTGDPSELQWYSYSDRYESYVPARKVDKKISFFITDEMKNSKISILAPANTAVFIENDLWFTIENAEAFILDSDSLLEQFGNEIFITLYHPKSLSSLDTSVFMKNSEVKSEVLIHDRLKSRRKDFFLGISVILLVVAGIFRRSISFQFAYIMGVRQLYMTQIIDNPIYSSSFFSRENIQFYVLISSLLSLLILYHLPELSIILPVMKNPTLLTYVWHWLFYSVLIYGSFYVKLLLYGFLGGIYNFKKFTQIQNYDFMRIIIYLGLIYFFLMLTDILIVEMNFKTLYFWPLLMLFLYLLTAYRKLNKLYSHTKLHLFSYLCVSEIVPGLFFTGILG